MMRIIVKKAISMILITEVLILSTYLVSNTLFANLQVAFLSSFFVIMGTSYAYRKMVISKVSSDIYEDKRDLLDEVEDPHGLYDDFEINDAPAEELNLKEIVKEEKSKIKVLSIKNLKHGVSGSISLFRIVPYIFLVLGFIGLKNNDLLSLKYYLPSLFIGIIVGSLVSKEFATQVSDD